LGEEKRIRFISPAKKERANLRTPPIIRGDSRDRAYTEGGVGNEEMDEGAQGEESRGLNFRKGQGANLI